MGRRFKPIEVLHDAIWRGDIRKVVTLVGKTPNLINRKSQLGCTALYSAVQAGSAEMVKLLLERGADVNTKAGLLPSRSWGNDVGGDCATALHLAVVGGMFGKRDRGVIKLLLEHGADVNTTDIDGMTPLEWALVDRDSRVIKLLRTHGASINKQNPFSRKHTATLRRHWTVRDFDKRFLFRLTREELLAHVGNQRKRDRHNAHERMLRLKAVGGHFTRQQFLKLCGRLGNVCLCCGKHGKLRADHVVPISMGGRNIITNIQPLCPSCNSKKSNMTVDFRSDTRASRRIRALLLGQPHSALMNRRSPKK